jgi:hypothetical protein
LIPFEVFRESILTQVRTGGQVFKKVKTSNSHYENQIENLKGSHQKSELWIKPLELESGHIKRNLVFSKFMIATNFVAPFAFCLVIL